VWPEEHFLTDLSHEWIDFKTFNLTVRNATPKYFNTICQDMFMTKNKNLTEEPVTDKNFEIFIYKITFLK